MPAQPVFQLLATAPDDAALIVELLPPSGINIRQVINEPSVLTCTMESLTQWVYHESSDQNPAQLNALLTLKRTEYLGAVVDWSSAPTIWQGKIESVLPSFMQDEAAKFEITATGKLGRLRGTRASINGNSTGALMTPTLDLDAVQLLRVQNAALPEFAYFPVRTNATAWLPASFRPVTTTLSANALSGGTVLVLQDDEDSASFPPSGFVVINSEWIYYSGLQKDGAGGVYQMHGLTRGVLGTTAAGHTAGDTVTLRVPARMADVRAYFLEKQVTADSSWVPMQAAYEPVEYGGYFAFDYDIMGFAGEDGPFNANPRATYAVFDEDSADALTIGSFIRALLTESQDDGGPGWVENTDFTISAELDEFALARIVIEETMNTYDAILFAFNEGGLTLGNVNSVTVMSEDWVNNMVKFGLVSQLDDAVTADVQLAGTIERKQARSLENIPSRVDVDYIPFRLPNLLSPDRAWHPALNDAIGANGELVKKIIWRTIPNSQEDADKGLGWQQEPSTTSNAQRIERALDDSTETAWGLQTTNADSPGADADVLVCWFEDADSDGDPEAKAVGRIICIADFGWTNQDTDPVHFEILGLAGSGIDVTTDPPTYTSANEVRLSGNLERRFRNVPDDIGNMRRFQEEILETETTGQAIKGIIVRYQGMPIRKGLRDESGNRDGENRRTAAIVQLRVEPFKTQTVSCEVTATANQGVDKFYAEDSFNKLRDLQSGEPRVLPLDAGLSDRVTAQTYARLALINGLLLIQDHDILCNVATSIPRVGWDTVEVMDAGEFSATTGQWQHATQRGVPQMLDYHIDLEEGETLQLQLRNYRGDLIQ